MRSQNYDYIQQIFDAKLDLDFKKRVQAAIHNSESVFKKAISLSLAEGQLLDFLIQQNQCLNFVEIGTLTGHSALWIMKALNQNQLSLSRSSNRVKCKEPNSDVNRSLNSKAWLYTFEKDPKHAELARSVLQSFSGMAEAEILIGDAVEKLPMIELNGPFDGIFIDGNKSAYGQYLDWAERNLKKGALVVADNVFLSGQVFAEGKPGNSVEGKPKNKFSEKQVKVMQEFNQRLADPKKYTSALIPTEEGLFVAKKLF